MTPPRFRDPIEWEASLPGVRPSSPAWRATIRAAYGSPLDPAELELYRQLSGGVDPPEGGSPELLVVGGRRGGKSETIARVAMFEGQYGGHEIALAPGQLGLIAIISPLREQSQEILGYARGLAGLRGIKAKVAKVTADAVELRNGISIRVMTADAVALSGPTCVCAIRDEWAKWPGDESATPDREIENSLRPALAPVAGAPVRRLIGITSAYLEEGLAYETEQQHFGRAGAPVTVLRGYTTAFNPNVDRAWLARERKRVGERVYQREYECRWQPAITTGWFGDATIAKSIDAGRDQSAPHVDISTYIIAIDQAFKSDRFAVAVAHAEVTERRWHPGIGTDWRDVIIPPVTTVDYVHAWRASGGVAMSVDERACDVAALAKRYRTDDVYCDQFGAEPLKAVFARHGIRLIERPWTGQNKPLKYRIVRDAMNDGHVRLPDHPELRKELSNIQGKQTRSGGEQIEAHRGGDDLVSAAVLAISEAMGSVGIRYPGQRDWDRLTTATSWHDGPIQIHYGGRGRDGRGLHLGAPRNPTLLKKDY